MDTQDLTVEQLSTELQVHPETIRQWIKAGRFPTAYRLPAKRSGWRIPRGDVDALKNELRRQPRQDDEA